jgi:hypothetical protein
MAKPKTDKPLPRYKLLSGYATSMNEELDQYAKLGYEVIHMSGYGTSYIGILMELKPGPDISEITG